jgi:hypothetical protein
MSPERERRLSAATRKARRPTASWIAQATSGSGATTGLRRTIIAAPRQKTHEGRRAASITSSAAGRGIAASEAHAASVRLLAFGAILRAIRSDFGSFDDKEQIMAFSDFQSIEQVIQKYPLEVKQERFISDVELEPPKWFIENLDFLLDMKSVDENEAFYCEGFIFPFLHQTWMHHPKLKLWSHRTLVYDSELFGEPDYLVSAATRGVVDKLINNPLLAVVEAKKEDFSRGWAQCLATLIACQRINADDRIGVYGIVSTGMVWEFGKLEGKTFTKHPVSYAISEPNRVLGILNFVFTRCEKQIDM